MTQSMLSVLNHTYFLENPCKGVVVLKYSSGITYRPFITFLKPLYDAVSWFQLEEIFFNYEQDADFVFSYIASVSSVFYKYFVDHIFVAIENQMSNHMTTWKVIVAGD